VATATQGHVGSLIEVKKMAILWDTSGSQTQLVLTPLRVEEPYLTLQLELFQAGERLLSEPVGLEKEDLVAMQEGIRGVCSGRLANYRWWSLDFDFAFDLDTAMIGSSHVAVGFWVGEPYVLMKGYRFVALQASVEEFGTELDRIIKSNW
jgi:hypothetical protein